MTLYIFSFLQQPCAYIMLRNFKFWIAIGLILVTLQFSIFGHQASFLYRLINYKNSSEIFACIFSGPIIPTHSYSKLGDDGRVIFHVCILDYLCIQYSSHLYEYKRTDVCISVLHRIGLNEKTLGYILFR